MPDGNANTGPQFWGNKFGYDGADSVQALSLIHDMIYTDKSIPSEVTGLKEHMPLLWSGKLAMINYWHGAVGEIKAYNNAIDKGEVQGVRADFPLVLLPWPYDPENGANVNIARTTGLAVFRQEPDKGDAHMQNVVDFVRFLTSPINLATFANWEGTIPAKTSAYPYATQLSDPQIAWWVDYAKAHSIKTYPFGHPAFGPVWTDAMNAVYTDVLNDAKTPDAGGRGMDPGRHGHPRQVGRGQPRPREGMGNAAGGLPGATCSRRAPSLLSPRTSRDPVLLGSRLDLSHRVDH